MVDHVIELVPKVNPPTHDPYRMSLYHIIVLLTHIQALLELEHLHHPSPPLSPQYLPQKKKDGSLQLYELLSAQQAHHLQLVCNA